MCITIPSSAHVQRTAQWRAWQWLTRSPLRLYLSGGAVLLLPALGVQLAGLETPPGWFAFNLIYALAPLVVLGAVFEFLPPRLKVTPLTHVRLTSLFFLLLLSQLLFYGHLVLGLSPGTFYLLLLGLAWLQALLTLRGMHRFGYGGQAGAAAFITLLLLLSASAGLLTAVALYLGWLPALSACAWVWGGPFSLYVLILLVLGYPVIRAGWVKFT